MEDYSTLARKRDDLLKSLALAQRLRNTVVEPMLREQLKQVRDQIKSVVKQQQNQRR